MNPAATTSSRIEGLVWVFQPGRDDFPCGVWSSKGQAEEWIRSMNAEGVLSAYVLNESAYDSNVRLGLFTPVKAQHRSPEFQRTFTTAVEHFHYPSDLQDGSSATSSTP